MEFNWLDFIRATTPVYAVMGFAGGGAGMLVGWLLMCWEERKILDPTEAAINDTLIIGCVMAVSFSGTVALMALLPLIPLPVEIHGSILSFLASLGDVSYYQAPVIGVTIGTLFVLVPFMLEVLAWRGMGIRLHIYELGKRTKVIKSRSRIHEGFHRLALIVGVLFALGGVVIGAALGGIWLMSLSAAASFALGYGFVRLIGWVIDGFVSSSSS